MLRRTIGADHRHRNERARSPAADPGRRRDRHERFPVGAHEQRDPPPFTRAAAGAGLAISVSRLTDETGSKGACQGPPGATSIEQGSTRNEGKVCVFGSFNLNIVAGMARFPQPGESLIARNSMMGAGGKGANQATAALRAGARVHYIGKVGRDDFGTFARRHLAAAGFDAVTLFSTGDCPTGNALIYVAGRRRKT